MADSTLPVLYILMRTDMASQNAGRAAAQASHAANHFHHAMEQAKVRSGQLDPFTLAQYELWQRETPQGFGTAIVLSVNERQMREAVRILQTMGYQAGITHDPTYVLVDGETVHHIPVDTCAWAFMPDKFTDEMGSLVLRRFNLYPEKS